MRCRVFEKGVELRGERAINERGHERLELLGGHDGWFGAQHLQHGVGRAFLVQVAGVAGAPGTLPSNVRFVAVMHLSESERLYRPGPEQLKFTTYEEELHGGWEPFPPLHPNTLQQFQKMLELPFYSFFGGQFHGMNGPLPPTNQRRELYPHG